MDVQTLMRGRLTLAAEFETEMEALVFGMSFLLAPYAEKVDGVGVDCLMWTDREGKLGCGPWSRVDFKALVAMSTKHQTKHSQMRETAYWR